MISVITKQRLEQLTAETNREEINEVFHTLIDELQSYLDLAPIRKEVTIHLKLLTEFESEAEPLKNGIFSTGVKRDFASNTLILSREYSKYFPPLMLGEAYNCFLPHSLLSEKYVQIIIYQLVANTLSTFGLIDDWKAKIEQEIVDLQFIRAYFNRFKKFLDNRPRVQLIFQFLREKELIIESMGDALYENIVNVFLWGSAEAINDDELLETVRILAHLFQKHKNYTSLEQYIDFFQQYSAEGRTDQSQRQFGKSMGWIKDYSSISPSYQVNWMYMNVFIIDFYFKFNPLLANEKILKIMERMPFLTNSQRLRTNKATEITGFILVPLPYLNDFLSFVQKMDDWGYVLEKQCYKLTLMHNFLNLNYFREFHRNQKKLINTSHQDYNHGYELENTIKYLPSSDRTPELSILDLNILQRAINLSFTGFTFEKRIETLNLFREDLRTIITNEEKVVSSIQTIFEHLNSNAADSSELIQFIDTYQEAGFFYIGFLVEELLECLECIVAILSEHREITSIFQLQEYLRQNRISSDLKTNILCSAKPIHPILFREFIPLYFRSKTAYQSKFETLLFFQSFFTLCNKIKVFDLHLIKEIIEQKEQRKRIYKIRKEKLNNYYEIFNPQQLTINHIEAKVEQFINHDPPILTPMLINTITTSSFCTYFPRLILKDTSKTRSLITEIIPYFPRSLVYYVQDVFTQKRRISILLYLPHIKEKALFLSIMRLTFSDDLISFSRNYTGGLVGAPYTFMDLYDLDTKKFFYNKDLFDQFFLYIAKTFGEISEIPIEMPYSTNLWHTTKNMRDLSTKVENRYIRENKSHEKQVFDNLLTFHTNLRSHLIHNTLYSTIAPLKDYIKSLSFLPAFYRFGLAQYYLFIHPLSIKNPHNEWILDWKLLLGNTFQTVHYPARLGSSQSFFMSYLFPYRNPNTTYLNWLTKSKRVIREYFLFFVKQVSQLFHFDSNLNEDNKWSYDADQFKIHVHHILFSYDYRRQLSPMKQYDLGTTKSSQVFGPDTEEFQNLVTIYNRKAADLRPYYYRKNKPTIQLISDLLQKELIFPYLTLKNLNFIEKIYIILPQITKTTYQTLLQIFDFFNYGFIYEIEGEYYIYGMDKEITFENGMMIELYFPDCKMYQFQELFEQVFHYFKIDHYLILNDLVDGKSLLKRIYGDAAFLKQYNPLTNLIWNDKDKRWMNHKLFTENFEPVYPPLVPEKE